MQAAVPVGEGAMCALLGVGVEVAEQLAAEAAAGDVCQVANDNDPGQVVLSGSKAAIDRAVALSKGHGVRRAVLLDVSAPFHSALMQPAAEVMAKALAEVTIRAPAVPLVANVVAAPISDPEDIRRRLVEQVTGTVRWRDCVLQDGRRRCHRQSTRSALARCLSGLAKRIVGSLVTYSVGTPEEVDAAARQLAG